MKKVVVIKAQASTIGALSSRSVRAGLAGTPKIYLERAIILVYKFQEISAVLPSTIYSMRLLRANLS
jgi:hypothetical protein